MAKSKKINRTYVVIKADPLRVKPSYKSKLKKTLAVGTKVHATKIKGYYIYIPALKGWTIWKDSKGQKYVRLVSVPKSTKAKNLLKELEIVAKKLIKAGVKYNANNPCTSLSSALKHKRTNCATFISFGLQGIGILPKGKYIWLDKKIHGTGRNIIKKKAKIAYPRKKWKQAKLKPGDICGFANKPHTMVYVGKDKNGHALWYSAGGSDVKPKNLGPKRKQKYENRTVYVRIRLK